MAAFVDRVVVHVSAGNGGHGVASVHRYGPAALVVDVEGWDELRVKMWCTLWLQRHLPR